MGKISQAPDISNVPTWEMLRSRTSVLFNGIISLLQGKLSFADNFNCANIWVTFVSSGETKIKHSLGFVPTGFLVIDMASNTYQTVYRGTSSWTNEYLYLVSTAGYQARILIF